ncbi:I78 family peptidase inhibitor [Sphingomonas sp. AOB5]|uniref:I78 family peptidase inhibitor n=1 Tax=Sphingomonas sp. AOB5 TaxID=3034017 RepID=UPI0023F84905|nr:I78 family peptidase inhibitor [Sphingomonas sp. AOB5]MDF7777680.1 I78 family peptidase inhibitor [Sphingomonas sp. AOB5]
MNRVMILLPIPLLLGAMTCHRPPPPELIAGAPPQQHCGVVAAKRIAMGMARTPDLERRIPLVSGAESVRWIAPDTVVTEDYRARRLNIHVDRDGVVHDIRCG